jgi:hypothetical protein
LAVDLSVAVHDGETIHVSSIVEFERLMEAAHEEASSLKRPNIISIDAANGNNLGIVVGQDEPVLTFMWGHGAPPYYVSRGVAMSDDPTVTCYGMAAERVRPQP